MSEKEERILILTGDKEDLCDLLEGCSAGGPCSKCKLGIPRSEAVAKMAKAMAADDVAVEGYKVLAEAALDALVGKNLSALDKLNKVN